MNRNSSTGSGDSASLKRLFSPRSIAVIGASAEKTKIGAKALLALEANGYRGQIYPVNPKYTEIAGKRCYPSVQAIPEPVDLAIISLPAQHVPAVLRDCVAKGVGYSVIFSSGFAEAGQTGKALQAKVEKIARETGLRVLGPNTAGMVFHGTATVASFASTFMQPPSHKGSSVAFVTQSGAFGVYVYNLAQQLGLIFDYYVNTGNEADLEVADFLDYLADRPEVRTVALYLEGVRDGPRFRKAAEKCFRRGLPVVAVKVGRSAEASRAAASHTGAMTGADEVYDAVFRQSGVVRVDGIMELLDLVGLFAKGQLPGGKRVGILTTTGGGGVWMADKCRQVGLEVPEFVGATRQALEAVLPPFAAASNPVDLTGQMYTDRQLFRRSVGILANDPDIDALVLVSGGDPETVGPRVPETIIESARNSDKPLLVAWVGAPDGFYRQLTAAGVSAFANPARCACALGSAAEYATWLQRPHRETSSVRRVTAEWARKLRDTARQLAGPDGCLPEHAAKRFLSGAGIPVAETSLARSADEAVVLAERLGYPVVVKAESPDLLHRSEAGAVALNLRSADAVRSAYTAVCEGARRYAPQARDLHVSVQPMLPSGVELLVGLARDPTFGPVLMVGLGGVVAEALRDYRIRVPPMDREQAREMLMELRGSVLLTGFRGSPPADIDAAASVLERLSEVAEGLGDLLLELDINPLVVFANGQGAAAADALMVIQP